VNETKPTEFENFKALTRRVMSVPKSKIDAREAEYKSERKKKTGAKKHN
jgi:hypothetical protein